MRGRIRFFAGLAALLSLVALPTTAGAHPEDGDHDDAPGEAGTYTGARARATSTPSGTVSTRRSFSECPPPSAP